MPAGDNEKSFKERMAGRIKEKLSFKNDEDVYISVDGHFEYEDKLYLVEIDSGNQAKLLAGQYILLNVLWEDIKIKEKSYAMDNCIFLVVHYYNNYNTDRTTNVLSQLKNDLELSLPFMILHEKELATWEDLIKQVTKNKEENKMYIFKAYNNSTISKFQKQEDFIEYLNQQSDMKDLEFDDCKYFEKFENDCNFKSIEGYVFDGFSLGWCAEKNRYKLLGYWTKIPCDDDNS